SQKRRFPRTRRQPDRQHFQHAQNQYGVSARDRSTTRGVGQTLASEERTTTGEIVKSDKSPSQIRNPKLQIGRVQSEISDFGFEMQESSDFKILFQMLVIALVMAVAGAGLIAQSSQDAAAGARVIRGGVDLHYSVDPGYATYAHIAQAKAAGVRA